MVQLKSAALANNPNQQPQSTHTARSIKREEEEEDHTNHGYASNSTPTDEEEDSHEWEDDDETAFDDSINTRNMARKYTGNNTNATRTSARASTTQTSPRKRRGGANLKSQSMNGSHSPYRNNNNNSNRYRSSSILYNNNTSPPTPPTPHPHDPEDQPYQPGPTHQTPLHAHPHAHHAQQPPPRIGFANLLNPDTLLTGTHDLAQYTLSILRPAITLLRIPLSLLLFFFLLATLVNHAASTLSRAFAPVCYIPGIAHLAPACRWVHAYDDVTRHDSKHTTKNVVKWADYPALVDVQSKTFEQMLDESMSSGSSLSLDIKKTEMATADLVALIRLSDLKSKESLAQNLGEFIVDAKSAGRSLHRLDAKMNGAIDSIMAMNDYALHAIQGAKEKEPGMGMFAAVGLWRPVKTTDAVVMETFQEAMNVLSGHLERLIIELETNYQTLDSLEEKLGTLRDIVGREDQQITADKEELLSYLWTKLGGNRKDLRNYERNLGLLRELSVHRRQASARVVATLHTLQSVSQDMEEMRERVAGPNLAGSRIGPEVHMRSIQNGLERLREGRSRAKQIEEAALRRALGDPI